MIDGDFFYFTGYYFPLYSLMLVPRNYHFYMTLADRCLFCQWRIYVWRIYHTHNDCVRLRRLPIEAFFIKIYLLRCCSFGVGFPKLVNLKVTNSHVLDPVTVPLIQFSWFYPSYGRSEGAMCSWAVGAYKNTKV